MAKTYMSIFISTGAFKTKRIEEILDIAYRYNIVNIELAPGLEYNSNISKIICDAAKDFKFLIHNYFPTPKCPFALNFASPNAETEKRSIEMGKKAIDLCSELAIPYYSVHCGFCFETDGTDLGKQSQVELKRIGMDEAMTRFVRNIRSLCEYGKRKNIGVAIENNVLANFACGNKEMLLGVDQKGIQKIISQVNMDNLSFLVDLAHAKVSSNNYGFDMQYFIDSTKSYVSEVHVSENDGLFDQNRVIERGSDVYNWLSHYKDKVITIEAYYLTVDEILEQINIVNEAIS